VASWLTFPFKQNIIDPALYFVIPGLTRNPARINIGAPRAPLDTGLRRHDGATFYMPDQ